MYRIVRWFEIDAGHRVARHGGKCAGLHGHRYRIGVEFSSATLDKVGVVVDFADIKATIGNFLQDHMDHKLILWDKDPWALKLPPTPLCLIRYQATAEGISRYLFEELSALFTKGFPDVIISKIAVYETPNCYAEWVM